MKSRERISGKSACVLLCMSMACSAQNGNNGVASPTTPPHQAEPPARQSLPETGGHASMRKASKTQDPTAAVSAAQRNLPVKPGPPDEMVMALPPAVVSGAEDGASALPEDRVALKKRAKEELAKGHTDEALSIIDVLLVLDHDDVELLEIRGDIMLKQALTEDAAVDFRRCCKLGRPSCCR